MGQVNDRGGSNVYNISQFYEKFPKLKQLAGTFDFTSQPRNTRRLRVRWNARSDSTLLTPDVVNLAIVAPPPCPVIAAFLANAAAMMFAFEAVPIIISFMS
jgi:hypothetical protein